MTTQSPIPEYREFALQISGVSERVKAGRAVKIVEGPARPGMQFPDTFDCADPGLFQYLTVGANVKLVLKRSRSPKKKKDGTQYDGSVDWMWYWDVIGVDGHGGTGSVLPMASAQPAAPAAAQPAAQPPKSAPRSYGAMDEETTRRITFLSALNAAATYLTGSKFQGQDGDLVTITEVAGRWADAAFAYGRGEAGDAFDMFPPPETPVEAAPEPPPVSTTAQAPKPPSASAAGPSSSERREALDDFIGDPPAPMDQPPAPVPTTRIGLAQAMRDQGCGETRIKGALARFDFYVSTESKPQLSIPAAARTVWNEAVSKDYVK